MFDDLIIKKYKLLKCDYKPKPWDFALFDDFKKCPHYEPWVIFKEDKISICKYFCLDYCEIKTGKKEWKRWTDSFP